MDLRCPASGGAGHLEYPLQLSSTAFGRRRPATSQPPPHWCHQRPGLIHLGAIILTLMFPGTWIIVASAQDCQEYPATFMEPYDILPELGIGVAIAAVVGLIGTSLCVWLRWTHLPVAVLGVTILIWTWARHSDSRSHDRPSAKSLRRRRGPANVTGTAVKGHSHAGGSRSHGRHTAGPNGRPWHSEFD